MYVCHLIFQKNVCGKGQQGLHFILLRNTYYLFIEDSVDFCIKNNRHTYFIFKHTNKLFS